MRSYDPYNLPILRATIGEKFLNIGNGTLGTSNTQFSFRVNKVILHVYYQNGNVMFLHFGCRVCVLLS